MPRKRPGTYGATEKNSARQATDLYNYLIGKCAPRNALNELVRTTYRNAPISVKPKDKPSIPLLVNEVMKVSHTIVKFMSNVPEIRVPLPADMTSNEARYQSIVRERIIKYWWQETNFRFKYHWVQRDLAQFGYCPLRLQVDPRLMTRITICVDSIDDTVARFMYGREPELDFYGTKVRMTGDQIHSSWLNKTGKKASQETVIKNIINRHDEEYDVLLLCTPNEYFVVSADDEEVLDHFTHNLGFVPAMIAQNFPQPHACEGIADVAHIIGKNHFLNVLLSYAIDYLDYQTNPILFGKGLPGDTNMKELRDSKGGVNAEDPQADLKFVQYPVLSQEFETVLTSLRKAIVDETGINEIATSARTDMRRIDSSATVTSLNIGVEALLNLKREMFAITMQKLNGMYLRIVDNVYRPEMYGTDADIRIGSEFDPDAFTYNGADINGRYENDVVFIQGQFDMVGRTNTVIAMITNKLLSKKTAREMLNINRPQSEQEQIKIEMQEDIEFEAKLAQAKAGTSPNTQGPVVPPPSASIPGQPELPMMPNGLPAGLPGMSQQEAGIAPEFLNQELDPAIAEIKNRLKDLTGLKGTVEFVSLKGNGDIYLAISNVADKPVILRQLPEYRGRIKWIVLPGLRQLSLTPNEEFNNIME